MNNNIAQLSMKKFNSLPKTGKPKENEWTVLSCIVKEQNSTFEVVSLGTGSKCIGRSKMCPKGTIVNDSHAEILCRRAFLRYLYNNLKENSSIFTFNEQTRKFTLKLDIKFHFFTSHVPCGDAAIFPKNPNEDVGEIISEDSIEVPAKKRKTDDIFRTGAKCLKENDVQDTKGQGAAYHVTSVVRTKPGRGDPTASMSCSDKMARWCHLGLQGSLLMVFLEEPIYLHSFTILKETPFCPRAFKRALFGRLQNVQLIEPFKLYTIEVYQTNLQFPYQKKDGRVACASCISWFQDNQNGYLEIAVNGKKQGVTKKHLSTEKGSLKICKQELFKEFTHKIREFNVELNMPVAKLSYVNAKSLSKSYQENWLNLRKAFGVWTCKDSALLDFLVS